jgi:hypothetical protein
MQSLGVPTLWTYAEGNTFMCETAST